MRIEVKPVEKPEKLKENLKKRVESVEKDGDELVVKDENLRTVSRTPGIESFEADGEEHPGLEGRPVQEKAYARLESLEDAVKALLATIQGYDLVVLETERQWDLRQLRKYNPDIKQLKSETPEEELGIEKAINSIDGTREVEIEMPGEEETQRIYREMLT